LVVEHSSWEAFMGSAVDILIFIGQALAIAGIGYIVAQAFACTAKYRDPNTWRPADFSTRTVNASGDARTEHVAIRLSFVPESGVGYEDNAARGNEGPVSLGKPPHVHAASTPDRSSRRTWQ
jgi:hypothetical protein